MQYRTLTPFDKGNAAAIWKEIFGDPDSFTNWFFQNRFYPEYSACAEENGQIAAIMHAMPLPIKFDSRIYSGAILGGVATLPLYRGRGLMKKLMAFELENLRALGIQLLTHTPVNPAVYFSCDQFPCTREIHFTYHTKADKKPQKIATHFDLSSALKCYLTFAGRYNGIVWRNEQLMQQKAQDYFSDESQCFMLQSGAYCFARIKRETAYCQEIVYYKESEVISLLASLPAKLVTGRLPGDFSQTEHFAKWELSEHAVLYPLSAKLLTPYKDSQMTPGRRMQQLCLESNCFLWEEY